MLIEIQTNDGPRKVRVCDYCRTVCIPSGRFCSGRCARSYRELSQFEAESKEKHKEGESDE
jgi:hypothetical protein